MHYFTAFLFSAWKHFSHQYRLQPVNCRCVRKVFAKRFLSGSASLRFLSPSLITSCFIALHFRSLIEFLSSSLITSSLRVKCFRYIALNKSLSFTDARRRSTHHTLRCHQYGAILPFEKKVLMRHYTHKIKFHSDSVYFSKKKKKNFITHFDQTNSPT